MQITSKSAAYAVVRTAYHGGGVESVFDGPAVINATPAG